MTTDRLPHLVVVAYAMAPGPGGPEAQVNAVLVRALAERWPAGVTVISGGQPWATSEAPFPAARCTMHALGPAGARDPLAPAITRLAAALSARRRHEGQQGILERIVNRVAWQATGWGLKLNAWQHAASRRLEQVLDRHPDALVWSRALPYASIAAVARVRRERSFRWLVNINDPLPADVWPGLYASHPATDRKTRQALVRALRHVDALTFPCRALRDLEIAAFPTIETLPAAILPHIARPAEPSVATEPGDPERLRIAFAGTLNKTRISDAFSAAVNAWCEANRDAARALHFTFHLSISTPHTRAFLDSLPVALEQTAGRGGPELDRELATQDVLLDLKADADAPLLQSKSTSYLAFRKPIWVVGTDSGTVSDMLRDHHCGWVSPRDDREQIHANLDAIYAAWQAGTLSAHAPSENLLRRFSAARQIDDLAVLVEAMSRTQAQDSAEPIGLVGAAWP